MADKILIADDDPETLRLISLMLQRQGYQIVSATNGSQALALARSEHPDLIVLDVMMPDMDGFTVAATAWSGNHGGDSDFDVHGQEPGGR